MCESHPLPSFESSEDGDGKLGVDAKPLPVLYADVTEGEMGSEFVSCPAGDSPDSGEPESFEWASDLVVMKSPSRLAGYSDL
jgi:hypothetical protein